jgi:glycosyltransferase involved in cell wall biosynthesis
VTAVKVALDASAVPAPPGAPGRYVLALAAALTRRDDVELTVVSRTGDPERWPSPVAARAPALRPLRLGWEQVGLPRVVRGLGVEVHHGPHYTMPLALGLPAVVTVHDLSFFTHPEWHDRTKVAFFRAAIRTSARRAAALVAVSQATADLLDHVVRPKAPVHVIPHGLDHARFRPDDLGGDDAARARAGVTAPYVAFLGTLEPRKDVATLVRAFDRLAGRRPELTLVLAGATHADGIRLLGYVAEDDMPAVLRGASAVAYPSLEEGFGLPVLEALACGAPVVTTSGTVMEEVADGAALLAPPGDVDGLAAAIEAAIDGGPDLLARRSRGLEVAHRHTWEASAAAHAAVYRSVR